MLLIDEFDTLLIHPNFPTEFFATLRSLASSTDGLVVITASRLSITEMNRRIHPRPEGSPSLNFLIECPLSPLEQEEIEHLLNRTLEGTEVAFAPADRLFLRRIAGRHPYLVQLAASALFDAVTQKVTKAKPYLPTIELVQQRSSAFFDDLWRSLSAEAQVALGILAFAETRGRVHGRDFDYTDDLRSLTWYEPELRRLADRGLVERVDSDDTSEWGFLPRWRGVRWRIAAESLHWWLIDNPISWSRKTPQFDDWLQKQEYEGLLSREDKEKFKGWVNMIPSDVVSGAGESFWKLLKGWLPGVG